MSGEASDRLRLACDSWVSPAGSRPLLLALVCVWCDVGKAANLLQVRGAENSKAAQASYRPL